MLHNFYCRCRYACRRIPLLRQVLRRQGLCTFLFRRRSRQGPECRIPMIHLRTKLDHMGLSVSYLPSCSSLCLGDGFWSPEKIPIPWGIGQPSLCQGSWGSLRIESLFALVDIGTINRYQHGCSPRCGFHSDVGAGCLGGSPWLRLGLFAAVSWPFCKLLPTGVLFSEVDIMEAYVIWGVRITVYNYLTIYGFSRHVEHNILLQVQEVAA